MAEKDARGRRGEELAVGFLTRAGFEVIERNWHCAQGELDVVARDGTTIVVVEVKTRASLAYGHPFEAITPAKLARLKRLAAAWCATHPDLVVGAGAVRLDAVAVVEGVRGAAPTVEHLRGVF